MRWFGVGAMMEGKGLLRGKAQRWRGPIWAILHSENRRHITERCDDGLLDTSRVMNQPIAISEPHDTSCLTAFCHRR